MKENTPPFLVAVLVTMACVSAGTVGAQEWKIHASWCTTDGGSSGSNFRSTCQRADAFSAVIDCQSHNPGAQQTLRDAGQDAVNQYMASLGYTCGGAPRSVAAPAPSNQYYVIGNYRCAGNGYTGTCVVTTWADSCAAARTAQNQYMPDPCRQSCTQFSNMPYDGTPPWFTQDGPCRGWQ